MGSNDYSPKLGGGSIAGVWRSKRRSMAETHEPDTVRPLGLVSERSISIVEPDVESRSIERVRRTVGVTKEAARAISITALEAVREGAIFMGVIGPRGELVNPFAHVDAAIWSEPEVPQSIIETAYDYCEDLTQSLIQL